MTTGDYTRGSLATSSYFRRQWSGGDDPAHKAFNPYDCWIESKFSTPAVQPVDYYHPTPTLYYNMNGVDFAEARARINGISNANITLKALGKIREQILGHNFNAGIFAVELGESVQTVVNTTKACFALLSSIGRCDIPGVLRAIAWLPGQKRGLVRTNVFKYGHNVGLTPRARDALVKGDISSAWLALQYGWIPLVNDLQEALRAMHKQRGALARSVSVKKGAKGESVSFDARSPGSSIPVILKLEDDFITYEITLFEQIGLIRQLGLDNWASVVWEKIPFSFVGDWFIPIGSYLEEFGFWRNTDVYWQSTVYRRAVFSYTPGRGGVHSIDYDWGGHHDGCCIHVVRSKGTGLSIPAPSLKSLAKAASRPHLKNAAALIHQLVLRHRAGYH